MTVSSAREREEQARPLASVTATNPNPGSPTSTAAPRVGFLPARERQRWSRVPFSIYPSASFTGGLRRREKSAKMPAKRQLTTPLQPRTTRA